MQAIVEDKKLESAQGAEGTATGRTWYGWLGWITAGLVLVAGIVTNQSQVSYIAALRSKVSTLENTTAAQDAELKRVRDEFTAFSGPSAQPVTLVLAKDHPQPQGKAIYVQSSGKLLFIASNLPALPDDRAYELWLLPSTGNPVPAGVFRPDGKGSGVVVNPPLSAGVSAKGFAITVEPKEGSAAPTTKPMMVGLVG